MSVCNNCPDDVIPTSDKGLVYTGENIPSLNIRTGDNYHSVIQKLLNHIQVEKPSTETKIDTDSIQSKSNLFSLLHNKSVCASSIHDTVFEYELVQGKNILEFRYDLRKVSESLPAGISVANVDVIVTGTTSVGSKLISRTSSLTTTIAIPNELFPVILDIRIILNSSCGPIEMSTKFTIFAPIYGKYRGILKIESSPHGDSEISLTQANTILSTEIVKMKLELESLKASVMGK